MACKFSFDKGCTISLKNCQCEGTEIDKMDCPIWNISMNIERLTGLIYNIR